MSFLATYLDMVIATSLASWSKTDSMISSAHSSNRSLMESRDSSVLLSIFSSQKLISFLISVRQLKILSEFKTSSNLQGISHHSFADIMKKHLSMGSLWNLAVFTNSYPSSINSSIRSTWAQSVVTRADIVWQVNLKDGNAHQSSIKSENILQNSVFFSPKMIAFSKTLGAYLCFELEIVHQILNKVKNLNRSDWVGK